MSSPGQHTPDENPRWLRRRPGQRRRRRDPRDQRRQQEDPFSAMVRAGDPWAQQEEDRDNTLTAEMGSLSDEATVGDPTARDVLGRILADDAERSRLIRAGMAGDQEARDVLRYIFLADDEGRPRADNTTLRDIYREGANGDPTARRELNVILGRQIDRDNIDEVEKDDINQVIKERNDWLRSQQPPPSVRQPGQQQVGERYGGGAQPEFVQGSSSGALRGQRRGAGGQSSVEERRARAMEARSRARERDQRGRQHGDKDNSGNGLG